ncbi:hypothetical protein [Haloferula sp.]|uniref:hypothetical protein n=1 Tax=Haloferula sp. TaxID=2497595 RepID=UPI00329A9F27
MRSKFGSLILLMMSVGVACAQEEDVITTKILSVGLRGSVDGLFFVNGGGVEELRATMTGLGNGIDYKGPAVLSFYESAEAMVPKKGEEPPKPLARVRLPKDQDRVLLVIAPPAKGKKGPTMKAYGISTDTLKAGDYRFFNFSRGDVAVILGKEKLGIGPGAVESVSSVVWKKEVIDLPIKLGRRQDDGEVKLVYSSVWGHQPKQRNMIMVFDGGSRARPLEVRRFADVPGVKLGGSGGGGQP